MRTDLAKFSTLSKCEGIWLFYWRDLFCIWQNLKSTFTKDMLLGKIIVVSGQILKNNFAVWSHWCWSMMNNFKWASRMGNINVCPEVENVKPRPEEVVARGK